uniref:Uncharacterized protein n=1 Tax=viral metagenome TaxID=1070528 RepID=A0A6M3M2S9_9ZZZZ
MTIEDARLDRIVAAAFGIPLRPYSVNILDTQQLWRVFKRRGYHYRCFGLSAGGPTNFRLYKRGNVDVQSPDVEAEGIDTQHAVCFAALKFVGIDVEEW